MAKKSLGQNFLVDNNIARKIVSAISPEEGRPILEIGPGQGALTNLLAGTGAEVMAVEKDRYLAESLRNALSGRSNVEVIAADFLDFDIPPSDEKWKIIGNIPYNLTSKIISKLVDERERLESAVLMVQDEVGQRLAAGPGTKEYGSISIRLQLAATVERLFAVTPGCFRPRPNVDSRVIRITFRDWKPARSEEDFVRFVKGAFGSRRKMFRYFVSRNYGRDCVGMIEPKYQTGRIESFTPVEIYDLFEKLEANVRHK